MTRSPSTATPGAASRPDVAGGEPPVLCLHCSTGSGRQWQALDAHLEGARRVIAPDLIGYGANPPWPGGTRLALADEVDALRPALAAAGGRVDVVAHSFGAAVAVKLALDHPGVVRSLSLYEPVLFGLLREDPASTRALAQIFMVAGGVLNALSRGDVEGAARRFVDFWSGNGAWRASPEPRRLRVCERIAKVPADFQAVLGDDTSRARLHRLNIPVLCLSGGRSPDAVLRIADVLASALPRGRRVRIAGAGHMGPMSHAPEVNTSIAEFLAGVAGEAADGARALRSTAITAVAA